MEKEDTRTLLMMIQFNVQERTPSISLRSIGTIRLGTSALTTIPCTAPVPYEDSSNGTASKRPFAKGDGFPTTIRERHRFNRAVSCSKKAASAVVSDRSCRCRFVRDFI